MSQTPEGAVKCAATRIGISVEAYQAQLAAGLKYCWRCRQWKARDRFGIDRSRWDGRASKCVGCCRRPRQLPLLKRTNAEYERARYASDPVYRAERRQHAHARRRGVAPLPVEGMEVLTVDFGGLCAYCPAPSTTWDHLVPVSKGGRTVPGNIVPACLSCNSRKRDADVFEFMERNGIDLTPALDQVMALGFEWGCLQ